MEATIKSVILKYLCNIFFILLIFITITSVTAIAEAIKQDSNQFIENIINSKYYDRRSKQLIIVTNKNKLLTSATAYTYEKRGSVWKRVFNPIPVSIGKKGFANVLEKTEGDLKTPSGTFLLGTAFGYLPSVDTRLSYKQSDGNDYWIDDVNSAFYNKWVRGKHNAKSYEKMRRKDDAYKYGIVIEYNTNPVIKGFGSAIFIHIWRGKGKPTAGCVAMSEINLLNLLKWLNATMSPSIIMGVEDVFENNAILNNVIE